MLLNKSMHLCNLLYAGHNTCTYCPHWRHFYKTMPKTALRM